MARNIGEETPSIYRQPRRYSNLFRAALANPVSPETTALLIRDIIDSGGWQLRHLSGPDAAPFVQYRAGLTDEQWVDWNAQDDESWYDTVLRDFGLDARPQS
ncbi:MAG: hypothetical protein FJW20_22720 [Acidimicrobiia bacterium]|nr:hypothetical protein [Acidimicrobiia bacterium]